MKEEKNDGTDMSAEGLKHFDHLAKQLSAAHTGAAAANINIGDLCKQYHKIQPTLKAVLPFVKLIPKVGKTAAQAIEFLMGIAGMTCPIN